MSREEVIQVKDLCKTFQVFDRSEGVWGAVRDLFHRRYRPLEAVSNLNFSVAKGEILALIGPNGAGKSTSVKMLTGILAPSSGEIRVSGMDPFADRIHYVAQIGVVFGQRSQLWWDIAVIESLRLLKRIYEVSDADFDQRMKTFQRVLNIEPLLRKPVRKLSLGERMRCDLAASLIHNPAVLFLDEPTIGLDVVAKDEVRRFLREINRDFETTILLTTHDLVDIEELCERVVIIDHGKVIFDDSLQSLAQGLGGEVSIQAKLLHALSDSLPELNQQRVRYELIDPQTLDVRFDQTQISNGEVIKRLFDHFEVSELEIRKPAIEEVIRDIYRGKISAPGVA